MKSIPSNYDLQVDIARQIFMQYDTELLIRKFSLLSDDTWIYLTYLNSPCRISRQDGHIDERIKERWTECRNYSTVMTVYDLLCFHKGLTAPPLKDEWCTVGTFILTGITDAQAYTKKAAALLDGHLDALRTACAELGGTIEPGLAGADLTCRFPVTDFFPVLLQFWEGDEEFPPKLQLLWDRNADRFLHFETTFYLQGDLLDRLIRHIDFPPAP